MLSFIFDDFAQVDAFRQVSAFSFLYDCSNGPVLLGLHQRHRVSGAAHSCRSTDTVQIVRDGHGKVVIDHQIEFMHVKPAAGSVRADENRSR